MGNKRTDIGKNIGCILYPDTPFGEFNSAENLQSIWNFYSQSCKVAYILHDKDTGTKINHIELKPHYHVIIQSKSNMTLKAFQERWKISGHCCMFLDNWTASVQYLVHQNPNYSEDDGHHIYDIKEIRSNFPLDRYFNNLSSADPEYVQILKIINWAFHNKANYYQIMKYAGENGYFSAYRKCYRMIFDILGSKPYLIESQVVDFDKDIPKEFIKE